MSVMLPVRELVKPTLLQKTWTCPRCGKYKHNRKPKGMKHKCEICHHEWWALLVDEKRRKEPTND